MNNYVLNQFFIDVDPPVPSKLIETHRVSVNYWGPSPEVFLRWKRKVVNWTSNEVDGYREESPYRD